MRKRTMPTILAFQRATEVSDDEVWWTELPDPPYVTTLGDDEFVQLPADRQVSAYVNGVRVMGGLQALLPGDFVRVLHREGEAVAFRFAGRSAGAVEPGRGRRCAFTRMPIEGDAVRCRPCGRLVSASVVEQVGACVCGRTLQLERESSFPAEELL
jgi:hypothetical protein